MSQSSNESLWIATTPKTSYPALPPGAGDVDVAVAGGGIAGLVTAALLSQQGLRVAVVEAAGIAGGTTGHTTAKITSQHGLSYAKIASAFGADAAATYGSAQEAAIGRLEALAEGIDCAFRRAPACLYAVDEENAARVEQEADAAIAAGLPARLESSAPELPFPVQAALWFDDQAMFHARAFCIGLAQRLSRAGVQIYENSRCVELDDGDPCELRTDTGGSIRAHDVVVATHLPFMDKGLYFARTAPYSSYAMAVEVDGPMPQEMYLSIGQPARSLRPFEWNGASLLIVGGESHKSGQDDDTAAHYAALEDWARARFAVRSIRSRWSAHDFVTIDGIPYIGPLGATTHHSWVATGFKKWGMTNSVVAATILTDLIQDRDNPWASLFDSRRPAPPQGIGKLVGETLNVAKHFIGDRIDALRAGDQIDDLMPGTATVCSAGGERVAAYRDDDGALHAVSAKCTHLGCLVGWNTAEKTWDCPCHGSRFDVDGRVIEGPATQDLKQARIAAEGQIGST